MLIDWFTVAAQAFNFLLLVALLRWVLYRPILNAIDARERQVAAGFEEARLQTEEARLEAERYRQRREEIEQRREEMIAQAHEEAEALRRQLLEEARAQAAGEEARWRQDFEQRREVLLHDLRERAAQKVLAVSRQVLADLAGTDLERWLIEGFVGRVQSLGGPVLQATTQAIRDAGGRAVICTAAPMPDDSRERLEALVRERLAAENGVELHFQVCPELISGVELRAGGRRVSWSIDAYLNDLEEELAEVMAAGTRWSER